jgi:hypothetical protein
LRYLKAKNRMLRHGDHQKDGPIRECPSSQILIESDADVRFQSAITCHIFGSFSRFASVFITKLINQEIPIQSLSRRDYHHITASGLRNTDPNHRFPSSNILSDS